MIKYAILIFLMSVSAYAADASAFVVGLSPQQHAGSFDSAGQALTKELRPHSLRLGYKHGDHDFGVNWAAQNGVDVLFFLGYQEGCDVRTSGGRQCYADRSASLAKTYGDKVQYYEVWNEWNGGFGLGRWPGCKPACEDAAMYTDLLCRTHKAIKAVRPQARVVGGALSFTDTPFLSRMINAGAANCMDVFSFHPYVRGDVGSGRGGVCPAGTSTTNKAACFFSKVTAVDAIFRQKTGRSMPLAITEEGWSSRDASGEQDAATYLTKIYNGAKNHQVLEGVWWYELRDAGAGDVQGYGLARRDNRRKPSFAAFKAAAAGGPVEPPPPEPPPPVIEVSPDGATIPPLAVIGDQLKRAWTVRSGQIFLDGSAVPSSRVNLLLWHAGVIYQRNDFGAWWRWLNGTWIGTTDPRGPVVTPPPSPPPSPPSPPAASMLCENGVDVQAVGSGVMLKCHE